MKTTNHKKKKLELDPDRKATDELYREISGITYYDQIDYQIFPDGFFYVTEGLWIGPNGSWRNDND